MSTRIFVYFLLFTFSAWTGFTFVGYFTPILELGQSLIALSLGPWETFWIILPFSLTLAGVGLACALLIPLSAYPAWRAARRVSPARAIRLLASE